MPSAIRLFVDAALASGLPVQLSAGQAHYLGQVMRRAPGDGVVLFNGRDGEFAGSITALRRDGGEAEARERLRPQDTEPDLWLVFAPLKRDATELVVEKATELGVARLLPVLTSRTNPARLNLQRLTAIAIEAAEQCERLTIPRIDPPQPLSTVLADWPGGRPLTAAIERQGAPRIRPCRQPAALLVGPEGGFAPSELDALQRSTFIVPVSLGPRILRAETASIVGLALLLAQDD